MRILIACESHGKTRDAFIKRGHDAVSCDLLETTAPGPHYKGDVRDIIGDGWDMMIAHPDCTYLTCSAEWAYSDGPYHQKVKPGTLVGAERREARKEAIEFFRFLLGYKKIPKRCIENPKGAISKAIRPPNQYIHPYQHGHDASKMTGLWLEGGIPELKPTKIILPRWVCGCGGTINQDEYDMVGKYGCENCQGDKGPYKPRWANQTDSGQNRLTPGPNRWSIRAETYQGWSEAMADQRYTDSGTLRSCKQKPTGVSK